MAKKTETDMLIEQGYRDAVSTPAGRAMLCDLVNRRCMLMERSFDPASKANTAFREGKRNIGQYVLLMMNAVNPDAHFVAMKEARARDKADDANREQQRAQQFDTDRSDG